MITAYLGATLEETNGVGAANEAARATTQGALNAQILDVAKDLYSVGFPKSIVTTYAIAQMMMESDWMTSSVAHVDNNYSGIKYLNKSYQNATIGDVLGKYKCLNVTIVGCVGSVSPEGGHYAHFASFKDWAKDFLRVLSLNTGGKGRPIDATTAQDYYTRLRANHYFTDPNYSTKFNAALKKVNAALAYGKDQDQKFLSSGSDTVTVDSQKGITSNAKFNLQLKTDELKNWVEHNKLIAAVAGVAVILVVKEFFD